jgi:lysophospholipase L1-like esterase
MALLLGLVAASAACAAGGARHEPTPGRLLGGALPHAPDERPATNARRVDVGSARVARPPDRGAWRAEAADEAAPGQRAGLDAEAGDAAGAGPATDGRNVPTRALDPAEGPAPTVPGVDAPGTLAHLHFGERLQPVRDALAAIASGGESVRILYFGDSNIAFDSLTAPLRDALQTRFGDAGHGFVLVAPGHLPYGHRGVIATRRGRWQVDELVRGSRRDGRYGLGGLVSRPTTPHASATLQTARRGATGLRASRFVVYFQRHPRGGMFELRADDGTVRLVSTREATVRDDAVSLEVPDGPHAFTIRWMGDGELRLYGAALERDVPGVILDSLGIVGARTKRLLRADRTALAEAVRARRPTLVVMGFGANEASDAYEGDAAYAATVREALRTLRAGAGQAACLVVGPSDQAGPASAANPRTYPGLPRRVAVQRQVAGEEGCAFFDTFAAMGGAGSVVRWRRAGLAARDLRHLSAAGYARIARWLEAAITGADAGSR